MLKNRVFSAIQSAVALVAGLFIYLFLRSDTHIHSFLSAYSIPLLSNIKTLEANGVFFDFLKYYFADFLWGFALAAALCTIAPQFSKKHIIKSGLISFACGLVFEILQKFSVVGGTFDFADIFMYFASAAIFAVINITLILRRKV